VFAPKVLNLLLMSAEKRTLGAKLPHSSLTIVSLISYIMMILLETPLASRWRQSYVPLMKPCYELVALEIRTEVENQKDSKRWG